MFALLNPCRCGMYAEVIRYRPASLAVALIGAAQVGLSCMHCGFPCGFHAMTGLPCPGCGLSRSVAALLEGRVGDSIMLHPFGPPLLAALLVALIAVVLPAPVRNRLTRAIETVEVKTGITLIALGVFMMMWALRICGILHLAQV